MIGILLSSYKFGLTFHSLNLSGQRLKKAYEVPQRLYNKGEVKSLR